MFIRELPKLSVKMFMNMVKNIVFRTSWTGNVNKRMVSNAHEQNVHEHLRPGMFMNNGDAHDQC